MEKTVSFFGHRNADLTTEQTAKLTSVIEDLIVNKAVKNFLFGSRSDFDFICHQVVTDLKQKYPEIQRKCYTCRHETCTLESEREYWEKVHSWYEKKEVTLLGVEEEIEHKTKWVSGKASYVERNQAMIDDSDYCIFYYDTNYLPEIRRHSSRYIGVYQPKSGTALAYAYAKRKKKILINILEICWDFIIIKLNRSKYDKRR